MRQEVRKSGRQVDVATKSSTRAPDIFGFPVRNLLHVYLLAHIISRGLLACWKIVDPMSKTDSSIQYNVKTLKKEYQQDATI